MMSDANELRAKLAGVAYAQTLVATSTVDRIIAVILPIIEQHVAASVAERIAAHDAKIDHIAREVLIEAKAEVNLLSERDETIRRLRGALGDLLNECDNSDWDYKWSSGQQNARIEAASALIEGKKP